MCGWRGAWGHLTLIWGTSNKMVTGDTFISWDNHFSFKVLTLLSISDGRSLFKQHSSTLISASYLSSFKLWSPSSRSLKRKRGGSGGTSLSCCSILRVEMSRITPLLLLLLTVLVWSRADEELEEGEENSEGAEGKLKQRTRRSAGRRGYAGKGARRGSKGRNDTAMPKKLKIGLEKKRNCHKTNRKFFILVWMIHSEPLWLCVYRSFCSVSCSSSTPNYYSWDGYLSRASCTLTALLPY